MWQKRSVVLIFLFADHFRRIISTSDLLSQLTNRMPRPMSSPMHTMRTILAAMTHKMGCSLSCPSTPFAAKGSSLRVT